MKSHVLLSCVALAALTFSAAEAQQSSRDQTPSAGTNEVRGSMGGGQERRGRDDAATGQNSRDEPANYRADTPRRNQPAAVQQSSPERNRATTGQATDRSENRRGQGEPERDRTGSSKGGERPDRSRESARDETRGSHDVDRDRRSGSRQSRDGDKGNRSKSVGQIDHRERDDRDKSRETRSDSDIRQNRDRHQQSVGRERGPSDSTSSNQEQRERVKERFSSRIDGMNVRPLSRTNISVSIGAAVPRSVTLYDVPRDVVTVYPQYRGHKFVVVDDEIVVIAPGSRRIVATMPRGGRHAVSSASRTTGMREGGVRLSQSQRELIRTTIMRDPDCRFEQRLDFSIGLPLPRTVQVCEFPARLVSEVPEMESYRFVVRGDEIVVVDPREYQVIDVIE
jgi:hypothetical protein